jgi:hypothetical protein
LGIYPVNCSLKGAVAIPCENDVEKAELAQEAIRQKVMKKPVQPLQTA